MPLLNSLYCYIPFQWFLLLDTKNIWFVLFHLANFWMCHLLLPAFESFSIYCFIFSFRYNFRIVSDSFLLQDHAGLLFLHLESLIELFVFTIRINFWDVSWIYFFFFNIQNIKSNCRIVFLKSFPIIYFWWIVYSFPLIFIYKRFNIWNFFCISLNFFTF